jgi:hypothetical protein
MGQNVRLRAGPVPPNLTVGQCDDPAKWCSVDEEFVPDSPLEQSGFEPSVPLAMGILSKRVLSPA